MQWCVAKTGFELFDMLHAYGLAILLTYASSLPVSVRDESLAYRLSCPTQTAPPSGVEILDEVLALPESRSFQANAQENSLPSIQVEVLDGVLAALFTKGERILSVSDLLGKQRLSPSTEPVGLIKAAKAVEEWKDSVERERPHASAWVARVLNDYDCAHPAIPLPGKPGSKREIRVLMTIDPALGYSLRSPTSDGEVSRKINLAMHGARYATLLAFIGASRFLRAQRVSGKLVNLYVPLATTLVIDKNTALPLLFSTDCTPNHAAIEFWLTLFIQSFPRRESWRALAYQTLQTQGLQQSIGLDKGVLDCAWLERVEEAVGREMLLRWSAQLSSTETSSRDERQHLLDALSTRHIGAWMRHLQDGVRRYCRLGRQEKRPYSLNEVREITAMMNSSEHHPLRKVLEQEEGTLSFGRALRLLGRYNPALLRDLLLVLETVQTLDQLDRALCRVVQECVLAKAKSNFILIPYEGDFIQLVDDVHEHGVRLIVGVLMLLSVLRRYPPTQTVGQDDETTLDAAETDEAHPATGSNGDLENIESLAFDEGVNEHDVRE